MAAEATAYDGVHLLADSVYWLERRPSDRGRTALMRWRPGQGAQDIVPPDFSVGTWVNEYGGGAYVPTDTAIFACNADDNRIYRVELDRSAHAITPADSVTNRYADLRLASGGRFLVGVRERHDAGAVVNELVGIAADGSVAPWTLTDGHDFLSSPRPSPDGRWLAWITADLPNMIWDGSRLWVAPLGPDGRLGPARLVAGGDEEAVFQQEWSPAGELHFVSDRSGWWNLYRDRHGDVQPLLPMEAEFGEAQWEFDYSTYAFLDQHLIACRYRTGVIDRLAVLDTRTNSLVDIELPIASVKPYVRGAGARIAFIGSSPTATPQVMTYNRADRELVTLAGSGPPLDHRYISTPEEIDFPSAGGQLAHALYYPPTNPTVTPSAGELPPLIVQPHPGPTTAVGPRLDLRIQYFTSRGFAVAAVNYRGSTGYGRAYREGLAGRWGVTDVEDCVSVARHLIRTKQVDPRRIVISGASAGGFTALNAAASSGIFAAAVSTFGITDLESHRLRSPRFQAYKLDRLVGPYPEAADQYRLRSPVHRADCIRCPVMLFHGLSDSVVPPSHSRAMAQELERAGVAHGLIEFEGEGHGFGKPASIRCALEAELSFLGSVLGLQVADRLAPVPWRTNTLHEQRSVGL